jgi:hypothetical protein
MSAAQVLHAARAAGIRLRAEANDLILEAASPPPSALLDLLSSHKADIIRILRWAKHGWSSEDWHAFFDERAGIAEFDGSLSRTQAEDQAFASCVVEWLDRNPEQSPPGRCLRCDGHDHAQDPLLPFGIEITGHVWLHSRCWPAWRDSRTADAIAALATMGIDKARTPPPQERGSAFEDERLRRALSGSSDVEELDVEMG